MNNELYHYGVLGMKWGIRRTPVQLGRISTKKNKSKSLSVDKKQNRKKNNKKAVDQNQTKKKSVKDMSDAELRERINRIKMENEYSDLSQKEVSKGKIFAKRMLNNVVAPAAEDVAKQLVKSALTKTVNNMFKLDDESKVYTNNKKK